MKKILKTIVTAVAVLLPIAFGGASAFATTGTCQIGYTGPDSNNQCTLTSTYTCTVKNNNDFDIKNSNDQLAGSGSVTSTGNTSTGSVSTGSATNSNGTTINVSVQNNACTVVKTVPATPPTTTPVTVTPSQGGKGATIAPVPAPAAATTTTTPAAGGKGSIAVLPDTSSDSLLPKVVGAIALTGIAAGASRLVVFAYNRIKG